jgi:hypothetical protein
MNDRPTAPELLSAARVFLESELLPTLTDARLRFQTLVTANVLAIVERELLAEEEHLLAEWQTLAPGEPVPSRLAELRQAARAANERLCEQVRRGEFDEPERFRALCMEMRVMVERKLEVANPRYLASFRAGG